MNERPGQCGAERMVIAMDLTERTLESRSIFEGKIVTLLVDQAEQVLAEALCCLGGGAEAGRAMDRKLPGEKSRGTARLRQ